MRTKVRAAESGKVQGLERETAHDQQDRGAKSKKESRKRGFLRFMLTSWRRRALLVLLEIGLLILFRNPLYHAYLWLAGGAIRTLGVGLAVALPWFGFLVWMALKRRSWLVRWWNVWLGSLFVLWGLLGSLAFWNGSQGILQEATLGGNVGHAVIAYNRILGGFIVFLLFFVGSWVISPKGTSKGVAWAWRMSIAAVRRSKPHVLRAMVYAYRAILRGYAYSSKGLAALSRLVGRIYRRTPLSWLLGRITGSTALATITRPFARGADSNQTEGVAVVDPEESAGGLAEGVQEDLQASGEVDPATQSVVTNEQEEAEGSSGNGLSPKKAVAQGWKLPPISLLVNVLEGGISPKEQRRTAETIERTLSEYGIEVNVTQIKPGPTVTLYGVEPGWNRRYKEVKAKDKYGQIVLDKAGNQSISTVETKIRVKVDTIVAREKDLALALAASSIRIQAPVPGESVIGVEVPNPEPSLVTLRSVMESKAYRELRAKARLPIALGKGSGGEVVVTDLASMPHLLIAGATGSGKSVCMNSVISCLIMEKTPAELRLLLVDPKRVELNSYNGISHLLQPAVVETDKAINLLKGLIIEMMNRYRVFEGVGARNIEAHNRKAAEKMPYIVVCIDELADLMMTGQYDVEHSLCRLAQLGRATGIHLVLATQRPSVDVVTGLIKANFPSRISFAVASQVDSRTILDSAGADKLLGRGDMLYLPIDGIKSKRVQGVFISDQEIESLVRFWKSAQGPTVKPISLESVQEGATVGSGQEEENRDELLVKAIELAKSYSRLSPSLLQRRLRIGYPRAARLMEQLEEEGIVSQGEPGKSRDVLVR